MQVDAVWKGKGEKGKGKRKDKVGTDTSTSQDTERKFHCDQVGHMKDCQKRNSDSASATDVPSLT